MARYPNMRFSVLSDVNTKLVELLQDGLLDVVFCATFAAEHLPDLSCENLGEDELSVILRTEHPLTRRKPVTMEDLVAQEWIMQQPNYLTLKWLNRQFEKAGLPHVNVRVETVAVNYVDKLLRSSDLLAFPPKQRVSDHITSLPVNGLEWVRKYGAVYRRDTILPQSARVLIDTVARATRVI